MNGTIFLVNSEDGTGRWYYMVYGAEASDPNPNGLFQDRPTPQNGRPKIMQAPGGNPFQYMLKFQLEGPLQNAQHVLLYGI